jgi:hypothetical protein
MLVACGGESGTGVNTAEGLWQGTSSTGLSGSIVVLENGDLWGYTKAGNDYVSAIAGTASGNGTTFSASGSEFVFSSNRVGTGTYSGTVNQKLRIQGTSSNSGSIDLAYNNYYDQGITAAEIAGSYSLSGRTASYSISNIVLTIGPSGSFTLVDHGCTTSGTATPRASGKAIVNVSATGTGDCVLGSGVTLSGIAVLNKLVTPNVISVIALNSGKTDGLVLLGNKN